MKQPTIINERTMKNGRRRVTVELAPNEKLCIAPKDGEIYRLGNPLETDYIAGHILNNASRVYWCSVAQEFVDAN